MLAEKHKTKEDKNREKRVNENHIELETNIVTDRER